MFKLIFLLLFFITMYGSELIDVIKIILHIIYCLFYQNE